MRLFLPLRDCLDLCYENVYRLFLSETRLVLEEIAGLLPQENITKLQPTCEASLKTVKTVKAAEKKKHKQIIR